MRVYIYAMENTYCGLYGMYNVVVEEMDDEKAAKQANEIGREMSDDIMVTYDSDFQDLVEDEDAWEENLCWGCFKIRDDVTLTTEELNDEAYGYGDRFSKFIEKYCEPEGL